MNKGRTMECPKCGNKIGGVSILVGVVKITTFKCTCGRIWRIRGVVVSFSIPVFTGELERLHTKYPSQKPWHVKIAIDYLQAKVDDHQCAALEKEEALRRKRADHWEKQFMKQALGEDY